MIAEYTMPQATVAAKMTHAMVWWMANNEMTRPVKQRNIEM